MPSCCVLNCLHNSFGPFRLFRFPADEERRLKWAVNCGRINWFPNDYTRICEVHFDESQFEQKRRDGKKLLKWNAVPTLFNTSDRPKGTIKRNFWRKKDSEDETSPEAPDEIDKTTAKPRSCDRQGPLTDHEHLQETDEISLIKAVLEKMGHEVQSENFHFEFNQHVENKITNDSVSPAVAKKVKSPVRKPPFKRYPPKRIKLQAKILSGQDSNVTEEIPRAQEEAWKCAEETDVPKEEPEDREDELAQIKAEIKKLLKEASVDQLSGSHILKSAIIPTMCTVSSLPPRIASVKKHVQNGMTVEETTSSRSFIILSPLSTEISINGRCKDQDFVENYTVISEKNRCLPVEVGIQTDNVTDVEVVSRLKAEVELLKHQLAEKNKKIHQLEQRLAAILQPGQVLLLQKFGSNLSGAKKFVILGKQPGKIAAEKVS
ncbi:uncharacterized protein LOC110833321 isoform X2 [Zootermopsis nevadensis]|uniref:THAP domain-containing protein 4 n=1 Tax=Zootermopsis nevadensis TaxID=136037 RepID=A0A067RAL7_ZOONE|nr:uncharacterized protein LOC110833321 isoform X2 [Zootermopsis nevadensis]KDR15670.1 THAP domain-containing protein 4 [Zootermopsis nevadensis]